MGYYTYFDLDIDDSQVKDQVEKKKQSEIEEIQQSNISNELKKRLIKDVEKMYETSVVTKNDVVNFLSFNPFGDHCKWYEHTEDMRNVSKKYPNVLFTLTGNGEEPDDMWVKYFMNGKVQIEKAVITYGKFDLKKLVEV
jgi:hypothetical protein